MVIAVDGTPHANPSVGDTGLVSVLLYLIDQRSLTHSLTLALTGDPLS
jgi:hypothetical protein